MKLFRKIILHFIVLFALLGCSNETKQVNVDFNNVEKTFKKNTTAIKFDEKFSLATNICLLRDYILIVDIYPLNEYSVYIYDKKSFKLLARSGRVGGGPKEVNRPQRAFKHFKNNNTFYIYDSGKSGIWKFNAETIVKGNEKSIFNEFQYRSTISDIGMLNDTLFLINSFRRNHLISLININGEVEAELGANIIEEDNWDKLSIFNINNFDFCILADQRKYFISFNYFPVLLGYNIDGKQSFKTTGKDYYRPELIKQEDGIVRIDNTKSKLFCIVTKTDGEFLYSSYSGEVKSKKQQGRPVMNFPDRINIFDLKGNIISQIQLDKQFVDFDLERNNDNVRFYLQIISEKGINMESKFHYFDFHFSEINN